MNKLIPFSFLLLISLLYSASSKAQGSGNALNLDGLNGYVLSSTSNRGISNQVSVEAWVNTTTYKYQWVLGKYDRYGAERGYHLIIKDGKAAFAGRDGSGIYRIAGYSSVNISDGKWHHLAGVCDGSTWSIFVDGILQGSITTNYTGTSLTNSAPFAIGKYFLYDDEYYEGKIDEVRVWKKALTQEEIRQNMCAKLLPSSSDLVAYFNFDEAGSGTFKDKSNQKLDGTLQNISASAARRISGAPIGDNSAYRYTSNWQGQVVELSEDGGTFIATGQGTGTQGIHIYHVSAAPNTSAGIPDPNQAAGYFGLFKVGSTGASYSVQYRAEVASCSQSLFRRPDNAATEWAKVAEASLANPLTHNGNEAQGEYNINSSNSKLAAIQSTGDFCTGSAATLSINASGTVLWSTGETTRSISVSQAGEYSVTVTENACTYSDKIVVAEIAYPAVDLGPDRFLCTGETARLVAPDGYTYRWSTGATTSSIEVGISGEHWVEVTNSGGCTAKDALTVTVNPQPDIPLKEEIVACYGEEVLLNAATADASYIWSTGQTASSISVAAPAEVRVAVTVAGCTYTRNISVKGEECPIIPNIITPNGDGKNDTFVALGVEKNMLQLHIFDRLGKSVFRTERYDNNWAASGMPAGMYYYQFTSPRTQKIYKGWVEVVR